MKIGVIDPAMVTRAALENAASVAGLLLTTEAAGGREAREEAAGHAGHARWGHGRDGWHGRHGRHGWHGRHGDGDGRHLARFSECQRGRRPRGRRPFAIRLGVVEKPPIDPAKLLANLDGMGTGRDPARAGHGQPEDGRTEGVARGAAVSAPSRGLVGMAWSAADPPSADDPAGRGGAVGRARSRGPPAAARRGAPADRVLSRAAAPAPRARHAGGGRADAVVRSRWRDAGHPDPPAGHDAVAPGRRRLSGRQVPSRGRPDPAGRRAAGMRRGDRPPAVGNRGRGRARHDLHGHEPVPRGAVRGGARRGRRSCGPTPGRWSGFSTWRCQN